MSYEDCTREDLESFVRYVSDKMRLLRHGSLQEAQDVIYEMDQWLERMKDDTEPPKSDRAKAITRLQAAAFSLLWTAQSLEHVRRSMQARAAHPDYETNYHDPSASAEEIEQEMRFAADELALIADNLGGYADAVGITQCEDVDVLGPLMDVMY